MKDFINTEGDPAFDKLSKGKSKWTCETCKGSNTELYKTIKQGNKTTRYYRCKDCKKIKDETGDDKMIATFQTIELRRCDYHLLGEMERLIKNFRR